MFITGTDTGVGKTFVTSLIAQHFRSDGLDVGVMKPISTGPANENDAVWLKKTLQLDDPIDLINPISLKHPLAPYPAATMDNRQLTMSPIFKAYKKLCKLHDMILVEGIGGVLVPITKNYFVADMIKDFGLPTIIVARAKLGTINHTLLTIAALKKRKIPILGVIINGYTGKELAEKTNAQMISKFGKVPILAKILWQKR
ncbi:dethiobiotin synthase [Candidatus Saganbacteria bacterium]|nr:dethiobiotin synthase [Candidatus Saganbacteria bacterium]